MQIMYELKRCSKNKISVKAVYQKQINVHWHIKTNARLEKLFNITRMQKYPLMKTLRLVKLSGLKTNTKSIE